MKRAAAPVSAPVTFTTRQFKAGNSYAVRLPVGAAYPPGTVLSVVREGQKTILEPKEETHEAFAKWLLSLPQSAQFERQEMEYDPEEKWPRQN